MMRLVTAMQWLLVLHLTSVQSVPVNKDLKTPVAIVCSNSYDDIIRGLRNNWQSPIMYLRKRGYIPIDADAHIKAESAQKGNEQTCSMPSNAFAANEPRDMNTNRHVRQDVIKGLLDINSPTTAATKIALPAGQQENDNHKNKNNNNVNNIVANKNSKGNAKAQPSTRLHVTPNGNSNANSNGNSRGNINANANAHEKGNTANNQKQTEAKVHVNTNLNGNKGGKPNNADKSFVKNIKDKFLNLFKSNPKPDSHKVKYNFDYPPYNLDIGKSVKGKTEFSADDFDREFANILSKKFDQDFGLNNLLLNKKDGKYFDELESSDKVMEKKFDKDSQFDKLYGKEKDGEIYKVEDKKDDKVSELDKLMNLKNFDKDIYSEKDQATIFTNNLMPIPRID